MYEIQIYLPNLVTLFLTCHLWIKIMGENQEQNMNKVWSPWVTFNSRIPEKEYQKDTWIWSWEEMSGTKIFLYTISRNISDFTCSKQNHFFIIKSFSTLNFAIFVSDAVIIPREQKRNLIITIGFSVTLLINPLSYQALLLWAQYLSISI